MKVMRAEGLPWYEISAILIEEGLLECHTDHRSRTLGAKAGGGQVCETCDNTARQQWKRYLPRLSEDEADVMEVRWEWIEAHRFIAKTCRARYIQTARITTTKTELIAGKEVETKTVREEVRINTDLLRLLSATEDKIARFAGVDIDDPESVDPVPRGKVNVNRATAGNGAVN